MSLSKVIEYLVPGFTTVIHVDVQASLAMIKSMLLGFYCITSEDAPAEIF